MADLNGKTVAILTENGFEEIELTSPKKALEEAGALVQIISPQKEKVKGWNHDHWTMAKKIEINPVQTAASSFETRTPVGLRGLTYASQRRLRSAMML